MDEKLARERFNIASKKFQEMREKRIMTDVILNCKGGNIFAHRCVLMATNQFFYDMFLKSLNGDIQIEFEFKEIPVLVLSTIISTLYGEVPSELKGDIKQIVNILETSHMLQERLLFKYCLQSLMEKLNVENCTDVWNVMVKYQEEKEEYRVMGFILDHISEVMKTNKLVDISIDQITDFILYASRILDKGDYLLLIAVAWGKKNQPERIEKVISLFKILEKLNFSNYMAMRFEVEYFAQTSERLKMSVQPLMSRLVPKLTTTNHFIKGSVKNHSEPIPHQISPPPSSLSSVKSTCHNLRSKRPLPSAIPRPKVLISPPPSSVADSFTLPREDSTSSINTFKTTTTVAQCSEVQVHFFYLIQAPICKMSVETYSMNHNNWQKVSDIPLPNFISRTWYPLVSSNNERFYFGITNSKKFVAFSESTGVVYVGPTVASARDQVSGVTDGNLMCIWNYEFIGQFNSDLKEWKCILPNLNINSNCSSLIAMNGGLYIHVVFPPILYNYDFGLEAWTVKKIFPENLAMKSIKCKCCHKEPCRRQLYFYTNEKQLIIYDLINDSCRSIFVPELETGIPVLMSCDQRFIIFMDQNKSEYFFYYPETNEIKCLDKYWSQSENLHFVTCDLSLL